MNPFQDCKHVSLFLKSVATTATQTADIDTKGFRYLTVKVDLDTAASTTSNPAVLKLSESNDTVTTNFADITAFVGDTTFTVASAETTKTQLMAAVLCVDLKARKRYVKLSITPTGAAQIMGAAAILSRADIAATNATQRGALVSVVG